MLGPALRSTSTHLQSVMPMEVSVHSPLKVLQRWGLCHFKASRAQGFLVLLGSFLPLSLTFILLTLADHPQGGRQWPPLCPSVTQ